MFRTLIVFTFGLFLGQEYGTVLPNVKLEGLHFFHQILKSDFYKNLKDDYNKKLKDNFNKK